MADLKLEGGQKRRAGYWGEQVVVVVQTVRIPLVQNSSAGRRAGMANGYSVLSQVSDLRRVTFSGGNFICIWSVL